MAILIQTPTLNPRLVRHQVCGYPHLSLAGPAIRDANLGDSSESIRATNKPYLQSVSTRFARIVSI